MIDLGFMLLRLSVILCRKKSSAAVVNIENYYRVKYKKNCLLAFHGMQGCSGHILPRNHSITGEATRAEAGISYLGHVKYKKSFACLL